MQFKYLKHDLNRYFYPNDNVSRIGMLSKLRIIVLNKGTWAIIVYRFMRWAALECRIPILKNVFKVIGAVAEVIAQSATGISIDTRCDIGPGLNIGHFGCIFIHGDVKIGKFCNIGEGNTIGIAGRGKERGSPVIGDFVYLGSGAKIIGKVRIGNHVAIGANAVVTKDLPDNAVAVGVPAKIISYKSSRDFIEFNEEKSREILGDVVRKT